MLEPTKEPLKPLSAAEKIASIGQTTAMSPEMNTCTSDQFQVKISVCMVDSCVSILIICPHTLLFPLIYNLVFKVFKKFDFLIDTIFDYLLNNISWNTMNKLSLISKNRKAQVEDWLVMGKSFKPI